MRRRRGHRPVAIVLTVCAISAGCSEPPREIASAAPKLPEVRAEAKAPAPETKPVTSRPANPDGVVPILEYHHIKAGKGPMFRTPEQFRKELETVYAMGFRPVTVSEYLEGRMRLAPGASPVVLTFDDSNPSQFQLRDDGSVDPSCGVGIWLEFAQKHPDFPVKGTFYVLPDVLWGQPKHRAAKLEMLRKWGSELGSHTVRHKRLDRMTDDQVREELAAAIDRLEALGQPSPVSLALPFGIAPKNRSLLAEFTWKGRTYRMKAAMLVGANPAPAPGSPKLDRYRIPRIQSHDGDSGSDEWIRLIKAGKVKPYVQG